MVRFGALPGLMVAGLLWAAPASGTSNVINDASGAAPITDVTPPGHVAEVSTAADYLDEIGLLEEPWLAYPGLSADSDGDARRDIAVSVSRLHSGEYVLAVRGTDFENLWTGPLSFEQAVVNYFSHTTELVNVATAALSAARVPVDAAVTVVGHSLGGMVGVNLAQLDASEPDRVPGVITDVLASAAPVQHMSTGNASVLVIENDSDGIPRLDDLVAWRRPPMLFVAFRNDRSQPPQAQHQHEVYQRRMRALTAEHDLGQFRGDPAGAAAWLQAWDVRYVSPGVEWTRWYRADF
ncbi:MAG: hypothetical protein KDB86_10230 [Actinobacteria bacterium]|nr:hypothetical protein [Actinomycetota bacterium]MCB9389801.1 hypothetical protein [Acidimicrobiia bacterium]